MEKFISRLKQLRMERNLSQEDVAKALKMTQQAYSQYERDKSQPTLEVLAEMAKFFNVTTDFLLGLSDF